MVLFICYVSVFLQVDYNHNIQTLPRIMSLNSPEIRKNEIEKHVCVSVYEKFNEGKPIQ